MALADNVTISDCSLTAETLTPSNEPVTAVAVVENQNDTDVWYDATFYVNGDVYIRYSQWLNVGQTAEDVADFYHLTMTDDYGSPFEVSFAAENVREEYSP